jgi:DNA-binding transcriptional LysR family regulator
MNPTIRQIRAFVVVAQTTSFTHASDLLGVAQPTLTVQIRRMEDALRLRLFDRSARSVRLTRSGEQLLPVFRRIVHEFDGAVADAQDIALGRKGTVKLAAIPTVAAGWLAELIASFRVSHPDVGFVIRDVVAGEVVDLVRTGEVDLGIAGGRLDDPQIATIAETADRLCIVYPEGHQAGALESISAEVLKGLPLVLMDKGTSVRQVVDRALALPGIEVSPVCEVTYMTTAVALVRAGLGVAVLPDSAPELRLYPHLRARPIDGPAFRRPVTVFRMRSRTAQLPTLRFCDHLAASLDCVSEAQAHD